MRFTLFVDPCYSVDCNDAECVSSNGVATCVYPDSDIHCTFEPSENGCLDSLEYNGVLWSQDDADWTIHSGPTVTDGTGLFLMKSKTLASFTVQLLNDFKKHVGVVIYCLCLQGPLVLHKDRTTCMWSQTSLLNQLQ